MKFGALLGKARHQYDCEAVATGHYARRLVVETDDGPRAVLARAADEAKDQTYFLYGLRQDQLWHSRFPLGDLTKPEVRSVARGLGLVTADKPESQEICFVPGGDYRAELRSRGGWVPGARARARRRRGAGRRARRVRPATPWASARAWAWRSASRGTCRGSIRRPTRSSWGGARTSRRGTVPLEKVTFVAGDPPAGRGEDRAWSPFRAGVRIRHRAPLVGAWVRPASGDEPARNGAWVVETDTPVWAIAPGQACVLYDGERVPRRGADRGSRGRRRGSCGGRGGGAVGGTGMTIGPALPLALLVGLANTGLYVLIRGDAGGRLPLTYLAASLGAWAGAAIAGRLGITLLAIGDFSLLAASLMAWVGIGIVAILATLAPQSRKAG